LRRLDAQVHESILESCCVTLSASKFKFHDDWASVITGIDEGIFCMGSCQLALGSLGRNMEDIGDHEDEHSRREASQASDTY
ncbi:hypothetical protein GOP47_0029485, partial [Adiantum capillus-veneris]